MAMICGFSGWYAAIVVKNGNRLVRWEHFCPQFPDGSRPFCHHCWMWQVDHLLSARKPWVCGECVHFTACKDDQIDNCKFEDNGNIQIDEDALTKLMLTYACGRGRFYPRNTYNRRQWF